MEPAQSLGPSMMPPPASTPLAPATSRWWRQPPLSAGGADVTQNIHLVSPGANETGSAAGNILGAASELSQPLTVLSDEVEHFLDEVKKVV